MKLAMIAAASAMLMAAGVAHGASTVTVPGTSDPFLAGAPNNPSNPASVDFNGVIDGNTDYAPAESPVAVAVHPGETITISDVMGTVSNGSCCAPVGPAGGAPIGSTPFTTTGFTALVSGYNSDLPINSLIGLFNSPSPSIFEIGAGKSFVVPTGASELYLATVDGYQWNNNSGAFTLSLSVPEPATWAMMVLGLGAIGAGLRMARRKDEAPVAV